MKTNKIISKSLVEVWQMKDKAYKETKHLSGKAYFDYIHEHVKKNYAHNKNETKNAC